MSAVRLALLVLLSAQPAHGYALKQRFERVVGDVWPLNVGQVYDALAKLERDGLIEPDGERAGARVAYRTTAGGVEAARAWLTAVPAVDPPPRDELAIRMLVARLADPAELGAIVQHQRQAVIGRIQQLGREKAVATAAGDDSRVALLDLLLLRSDADARWLDLLESRFTATRRDRSR